MRYQFYVGSNTLLYNNLVNTLLYNNLVNTLLYNNLVIAYKKLNGYNKLFSLLFYSSSG